jgi:hypothetical protein
VRHPLRKVAVIVNDALKALDSKLPRLYPRDGAGRSMPLERLLRAAAGPDPFLGRLH